MNFQPDFAEPPGSTLEEALEERSMTQAELARRTGLSAKHINQIVNGKAPLTPETAARLEEVLGIRGSLWNRLETNYREALLRLEFGSPTANQLAWLKSLPVTELKRRGHLPDSNDKSTLLGAARKFFRVASESAWDMVAPRPELLFRQSSAQSVSRPALAAWLEIVRRRASNMSTSPFSEAAFRDCLQRVRAETATSRAEIGTWLEEECRAAGVRVVFEPEISGARVSGAVFWLKQDRPVLALSLRGKRDDQVWFSFFHEAGHLLLHSGNKDKQWVDAIDEAGSVQENEADAFARNLLIPDEHTEEIGIGPGVVAGRIQRDATRRDKGAFAVGNSLKWVIDFGDYDSERDRWAIVRAVDS